MAACPQHTFQQLGALPLGHDALGEDFELGPLTHRKGGDPAEWPAELRVREWPVTP